MRVAQALTRTADAGDRYPQVFQLKRSGLGFTLIELLIGISMLAVLTSLAMVSYSNYQERARIAQATGELGELEVAINQFATTTGGLPLGLADIDQAGATDPWGAAYQYVNFAVGGVPKVDQNGVPVNTDYDLFSLGPDSATAGALTDATCADDIVRASNGGFFGNVSDYARLP